jgi:TetR/AcrR family transcriptional regulator, transcriptional repressor of bet genes
MAILRIDELRRRELIRAAFSVIKREGLHYATLAKIAKEAGASKGLVHHYFRDKQQLIELTMRYVHARKKDEVVRRLRAARTTSERLWAVASVVLDEEYLQPGFCRAWVSFNTEAYSNSTLARLQRAIHRRERSNLADALGPFLPRREAAETAIALKAMIEGFRFRVGVISPTNFDPKAPRLQVLAFLKRRVPGFSRSQALRAEG